MLIVAAVLLALVGLLRLHSRSAPVPDQKVVATPAQIQHGATIVATFCDSCHSQAQPLSGDVIVGNTLPLSAGSFFSSNLTAAGRSSRWTDGELFRAIRNGIDADGRWLIIMSYTNSCKLSDEDVRAIIAYLRSQPAEGRTTPNPPDQLNPLGIIMLGAGLLPRGKPVVTGIVTAPPKGPTAQYGEYIMSYQDCRDCHGSSGPDLAVVKSWKLEEFVATLRTGIDPGGHPVHWALPWRSVEKMDSVELAALYEYLSHSPAAWLEPGKNNAQASKNGPPRSRFVTL